MKKKTKQIATPEQVAEIVAALCFAVNHGKFQGLVMRRQPDAKEFQCESPITWFRRALEPFGVSWDD